MHRTVASGQLHRTVAFGYFVILSFVAALNYIPGVTDADGLTFGIFALDIYDDALHAGSALWALAAALISARAARTYLLLFGAIYLGDGLLGLATGSGYLDLGIWNYGIRDFDFIFKIKANTPHIALGGFALLMGLRK